MWSPDIEWARGVLESSHMMIGSHRMRHRPRIRCTLPAEELARRLVRVLGTGTVYAQGGRFVWETSGTGCLVVWDKMKPVSGVFGKRLTVLKDFAKYGRRHSLLLADVRRAREQLE